jgi:hypothetical protein
LPHLGITLQEITQQLIAEKHLSGIRGLYVKEVDPNGLAADVRLAGERGLSATGLNITPGEAGAQAGAINYNSG